MTKEFFDNNFGKVAGNLSYTVKARTSKSGKTYAHFSIANHAGNNTRFFNGVAWGKHASELANIGQKGNKVNIRYHLGTDKYPLKNGKVLHLTELVVSGKNEGVKLIQKVSHKAKKSAADKPADDNNPFASDNQSDKNNPFAA